MAISAGGEAGRSRQTACAAVAMIVLALCAAGCDDPSAEERYLESVCSATLLRAEELLGILDDVRHTRAGPGPETLGELFAPIERSKDVARKLGDDLRAIPRPGTETGRRAANYFETFARGAYERMASEEARVRRLPQRPTLIQSIRGLDDLESALFDAYAVMTSGELAIRQELPEWVEPFQEAESCTRLDELGSPSHSRK